MWGGCKLQNVFKISNCTLVCEACQCLGGVWWHSPTGDLNALKLNLSIFSGTCVLK